MSALDLIPASYRRHTALRRSGRCVAVAGAALFCLSSLCVLVLLWNIHHEETAIKAYQLQADRTASLQEDIRHLSEKKLRLEQALSAFSALRGTSEIPNALQALDAALNNGIWLLSLNIERQRERMDAGQGAPAASPVPSGSVTLVQYGTERWGFRRTLQISGMAASYNAVADFIQALGSQPGIAEVRILSSGVTPGDPDPLFTFTASAILLPVERPLP